MINADFMYLKHAEEANALMTSLSLSGEKTWLIDVSRHVGLMRVNDLDIGRRALGEPPTIFGLDGMPVQEKDKTQQAYIFVPPEVSMIHNYGEYLLYAVNATCVISPRIVWWNPAMEEERKYIDEEPDYGRDIEHTLRKLSFEEWLKLTGHVFDQEKIKSGDTILDVSACDILQEFSANNKKKGAKKTGNIQLGNDVVRLDQHVLYDYIKTQVRNGSNIYAHVEVLENMYNKAILTGTNWLP